MASARIRTHEYTAVICMAVRSFTSRPALVGLNRNEWFEPIVWSVARVVLFLIHLNMPTGYSLG